MAASMALAGWVLVSAGPAEIVVIATCAFIADAVRESIDVIMEEAQAKERGETGMLVVAGCLIERYGKKLSRALHEADLLCGLADMHRLHKLIEAKSAGGRRRLHHRSLHKYYENPQPRLISTKAHTTYLKIAEGCSNRCSYCLIGDIRGPLRSRRFEAVVDEAKRLADLGVSELVVVAQDVTAFGSDLDGRGLPQLIKALDRIGRLKWLRIMYAHPAHITSELISVMAESRSVIHYLDMPIQHASDKILRSMNRPYTKRRLMDLFDELRHKMEDIALRTTIITGFPGETERNFKTLLSFLKKAQFTYLGAFAYSPEDGTKAASMDRQVPSDVALTRRDRVVALQEQISSDMLKARIGATADFVVEEKLLAERTGDPSYAGRCSFQAPDVDGLTFLKAGRKKFSVGDFLKVRITGIASPYDLIAEPLTGQIKSEGHIG